MRALKTLAMLIVSLGLVISAYGDTQAKKSKDDKQTQKQVKQANQDDKEHKSGIKKVFRNPFKRQPKSQEADCRKFPNAAGCPDAKQAKQLEKQVTPSEQKVAKHSKPVPKQAFKPTQKSTKKPAKKNVKTGKSPVKKAHKTAKPKLQAKNQIAQK
jgi:hypothetical protein